MYRVVNLFTDAGNMAEYASRLPSGRISSDGDDYLEEMIVTVQIAVWGTALAVLRRRALGAAVRGQRRAAGGSYQPVRRLMDACRAINEMVFADAVRGGGRARPVRRRAGALHAHHRHPGEAVLRGGRGDRSAAGRGHPRHRRQRCRR